MAKLPSTSHQLSIPHTASCYSRMLIAVGHQRCLGWAPLCTYKACWTSAGVRGGRSGPATCSRLPGGPPCRDHLEEAELDRLPEGTPSYLTAAVGPPRTTAPRKFCSVCGDVSTYTCTRCGSRYCSRRCHAVHTETRCLKFTV